MTRNVFRPAGQKPKKRRNRRGTPSNPAQLAPKPAETIAPKVVPVEEVPDLTEEQKKIMARFDAAESSSPDPMEEKPKKRRTRRKSKPKVAQPKAENTPGDSE